MFDVENDAGNQRRRQHTTNLWQQLTVTDDKQKVMRIQQYTSFNGLTASVSSGLSIYSTRTHWDF